MTIAHISPNYNRYGSRNGYNVFAVGFGVVFCETMKIAKDWCKAHGFEGLKI